jgi:hypothetical protein
MEADAGNDITLRRYADPTEDLGVPGRRCERIRRDGTRCAAYAVRGARLCRHHGGKGEVNLRQMALESRCRAAVRRGIVVPEEWVDEYEELKHSGELYSLAEECLALTLHLRHELRSSAADAERLDLLTRSLDRLLAREQAIVDRHTGVLTRAESAALVEAARAAMAAIAEEYVPADRRADYLHAVQAYMAMEARARPV